MIGRGTLLHNGEGAVSLSVVTSEDFEALRSAVDVALSEAADREMDLSVAELTVRTRI